MDVNILIQETYVTLYRKRDFAAVVELQLGKSIMDHPDGPNVIPVGPYDRDEAGVRKRR